MSNLLKGFDASHHNGQIEWRDVTGADFAYFKATEGTDYTDPTFQHNVTAAAAHGLKVGAYLFLLPGQDASEQIAHFLDALEPVRFLVTLPIAVDVEPPLASKAQWESLSKAMRISKVQHALDALTAAGLVPMIYCSPAWWVGLFGDALGGTHLWAASYSHAPRLVGTGWSDWLIWQTDERGTIPGVGSGSVDLNVAKPHFFG